MNYEVLIFYKYVTIADPAKVANDVRSLCSLLHLTGRAILAEEGINATFEGQVDDVRAFITEFTKDPRFSDIYFKRSQGDGNTFPKLSVKVRPEIVGTHFPLEEADPRVLTAPRITPEDLRSWFESGNDFTIVDMRNSYEFESGHFKGAIDPGLENSRDLPRAIEKLSLLKEKKVLTVCTAGVRCEKMSAYLLSQGFKEVYQLDGGIHSYMEKYPGKDFLGTLYTFDQRITMDFGGEREVVGKCRLCSLPTETYLNCDNDDCHLHFLVCTECSAGKEQVFCSKSCEEKLSARVMISKTL
jgi:UPF0176 protein